MSAPAFEPIEFPGAGRPLATPVGGPSAVPPLDARTAARVGGGGSGLQAAEVRQVVW